MSGMARSIFEHFLGDMADRFRGTGASGWISSQFDNAQKFERLKDKAATLSQKVQEGLETFNEKFGHANYHREQAAAVRADRIALAKLYAQHAQETRDKIKNARAHVRARVNMDRDVITLHYKASQVAAGWNIFKRAKNLVKYLKDRTVHRAKLVVAPTAVRAIFERRANIAKLHAMSVQFKNTHKALQKFEKLYRNSAFRAQRPGTNGLDSWANTKQSLGLA